MKVLSVRQPWAWAIIFGGKDIENRDWATKVRGRVGIHASKGMTHDEYEAFMLFLRSDDQLRPLLADVPDFDELVRGALIGTVNITDCVDEYDSPWFCGDFGFVLADAEALVSPIECGGSLGFWTVPDRRREEATV